MVLGLCDRFHALPSQVMTEEAGILRRMRIEELAKPEGGEDGQPG
jgi:hypothetical protein